MTTPNPLSHATALQQVARTGGDAPAFNRVAMVCMGVMATASLVHALHPLLRELNARQHRRGSRGR